MSYNVDEFYRDIEHRLAWDMVKPEHKTAPLHDADEAWECACWTTPDHAAVPCPAPPTERVCDDCREPLDADACLHNADRPYCSACIGNCAECRADLADDYAAELSMDRDR